MNRDVSRTVPNIYNEVFLQKQLTAFSRSLHFVKVSKYGVFYGPYFPVLGLNTEIYRVNLRIQARYGKLRTRKNSVFEHFSPSLCRSLCHRSLSLF